MTSCRILIARREGHRHLTWVATGCLFLALGVADACAGEPGYYSGGQFHRLIVSNTEFAVELSDSRDRQELERRMRTSAAGTLEEVPWGRRDGCFRILRVSDASASARSRLRQMGDFKSINRVYRLHEDGPAILSSGRIVVRLRPEVTAEERNRLFNEYGVVFVREVDGLSNTYVVEPTGEMGAVELEAARHLYADARTVYAHPDFRMPLRREQFNGLSLGPDTFYDQQWHLENTGQEGGTPGVDIDIQAAWSRTTGSEALIGQIDDACDVSHEDLVNNYIGASHNLTDNSQSATAANPQNAGDRHGTAVMGLMVAEYFNDEGVSGVAPDARFTASRGLSDFITLSQIASAFSFARNIDVDVHNNSWGFGAGTTNPDVVVDAIRTAFEEGRNGLGMVVCFSSGNGSGMEAGDPQAVEVSSGEELATLSCVIGVGASNARDVVAGYSNFGRDIDVLAPSNDFPTDAGAVPAIVTTDNTDGEFEEPGYNNGGFNDAGQPNLADPNYTDNFGGTSASSAIVSGIAALVLSLEPELTATQVRGIIEHTCDQINPEEANYNPITGRSLRYGYGRVNAGEAVEKTFDGYYWPERVADVRVEDNTIYWKKNDDLREIGDAAFGAETTSVLVVESDTWLDWRPTDSTPYLTGQVVLDPDTDQPAGTVVANLDAEQYTFDSSGGTRYFGVYSVAQTARRGYTYGFGVAVNSLGSVIDSGTTEVEGGDGEGDDGVLPPGSEKPSVSIEVSPLSGTSPLQVSFSGNAQSAAEIESFVWDFGDGVMANSRVAEHTYVVATGSQRFFPKLTVTDVNGKTGARSVAVDVFAADAEDGSDGGGMGSVTIQIASPDSPTSDISSGLAPLSVLLSAEVTGLGSTEVLSVFWDLGDGNTATSLSVAHSYQLPGRFPISVTVVTTGASSEPLRSTRFIDVFEDPTLTPTPSPSPTAEPDNGTVGTGCGAGTMMAFWALAMMALLRKIIR